MPKTFSGRQVVRILERIYLFSLVSQKGSHMKLSRRIAQQKITTVVPLHKELSLGTLRGVLDLAQIEYKDFLAKARSNKKSK